MAARQSSKSKAAASAAPDPTKDAPDTSDTTKRVDPPAENPAPPLTAEQADAVGEDIKAAEKDQAEKLEKRQEIAAEREGTDGHLEPVEEPASQDDTARYEEPAPKADYEVPEVVPAHGNADQKPVGLLAAKTASAEQNKNAIAEAHVSPPHGERVATSAVPERQAVDEPQGEQADPGLLVQNAMTTNGVGLPRETVNSGIVPDATVAETDGTYMSAGAPNETLTGAMAPEGLYTGAELNAAPLRAPSAEAPAEETPDAARPGVSDLGAALAVGATEIIDAATGRKPSTKDLFVPMYANRGNVMVCQKRLVERTETTRTLLLAVGAQVSSAQAESIISKIKSL